ncbi:penicillin-binding protein [Fusarium austroafricanum]|uniref:Penicillin-binding protein n=1 Tax=Fusarium austroafricanum TaxID=2364996 RepID=A0A8H4KNB5_9HYPO|nr:penicillin-binding protein [Fusarium austroafricanum]
MRLRPLGCLLASLLIIPSVGALPWPHDLDDSKYSVVSPRKAPQYVEYYYGVDGEEHRKREFNLQSRGYRPQSLSSYGPADRVKYAATWVQEIGPDFKTIHDVNKQTYDAWVKKWAEKGYVSTHVTATGPAKEAIFAGIMEQRNGTDWIPDCDIKMPRSYIEKGEEHPMKIQGFRISRRIEIEKKRGLFPTDIQGGESKDEEQYNVIFQQMVTPKPRFWTATGEVTGLNGNELARERLDNIMKEFMKKNGVRQAQVAIASNGEILAERGYTWAEDDRPIVNPHDRFPLASVSKTFLYAAITWMVDQGRLTYGSLVHNILRYYYPKDERARFISVQNLLDHKGGWDRKEAGEDIAFEFVKVAKSLPTKGEKPATDRDIVEYMLTQPLQFNTGEREAYSNYGNMLLGYLVSNITGMPYFNFLEEHILDGLDIKLYETAAYKHRDDSIIPESLQIGPDPLHPLSDQLVPAEYGGDGAIKEECGAAFSLAASASTVARFLAKHWFRRGQIKGARAHAESRKDLDWVVLFNTRNFASPSEFANLTEQTIPRFLDEFNLWGMAFEPGFGTQPWSQLGP